MFQEMGKFGGRCYFEQQTYSFTGKRKVWRKLFCSEQRVSFVKTGKFYKKMQKLWFSSNKASNKSQSFISSHHFDVMPSNGFTLIFYQPTPISHFRRAKNNVQFPFLSTVCGGKHALQLQFSSKPDSASYQKFPFCTGSKRGRAYRGSNKLLQKNLMRRTFQILLKISPHGF